MFRLASMEIMIMARLTNVGVSADCGIGGVTAEDHDRCDDAILVIRVQPLIQDRRVQPHGWCR